MFTLLTSPLNDVVTSDQVTLNFTKIPLSREVSAQSYDYDPMNFQIQQKLHPEVKPLKINLPRETVFDGAVEVARETERLEVISLNKESFEIEAVTTSSFFKFKDDVLVKILADGGSSIVHMRAKARLGKSDLGANAKRIQNFLNQLEKKLEP
ncbi:DUF1499 domain-containing protein [bacterium]|nr:DUF1499 domain-containing protein [bacterium]